MLIEDNMIKVIATNDHEGMEDLHIPSLFERTYTTSSSRTNNQLGLGVYIVTELVEKQQGTIKASNKNNLFTIYNVSAISYYKFVNGW